jgi:hypothetical protein
MLDCNYINKIDPDLFFKTTNLIHLDLSDNNLPSIQRLLFNDLISLNYLNLSYNNINDVDDESFFNLSSLLVLDLSKNFLSFLRADAFKGLYSLKKLCLNENKFDSIDKKVFGDLDKLNFLDLSLNMIKIIQHENFKYLARLEILNLNSNQIKILNKSLTFLGNLANLDLSNNLIDEFKNEDYENVSKIAEINLSDNPLGYIDQNFSNIRTVKRLILRNTNITESYKLNIGQFYLEELDLSFNAIKFISKKYLKNSRFTLKKLFIKNSSLVDWKFLFAFQVSGALINNIDFGNCKLSPIFRVISVYFTQKSDTGIRLSNVGLKSFDEVDLSVLNQGSELDLSHNFIKIVTNNYTNFGGSNSYYISYQLKYLDLSFNNISKINSSMFMDRENLKYLNLDNSFHEEISSNLYVFNDKLERISISNNYLKKFPIFCSNYSRSRVCNLVQLSIENNKLNELGKKDLVYLNSLKYLNLNRNLLSRIENNTFDQLIKLETLIISCNNLSSANTFDSNPFIFKYLLNIKELNLSSNSIEYLNPNLFSNLNKLTTIDLSSNLIYFVYNSSFNKLYNLKNLFLQNNSDSLLFESYLCFSELKSIKNIYISKAILDVSDSNKCFFKQLFIANNPELFRSVKNKSNAALLSSYRVISGIVYFNSINLLTPNDNYDCNLTLSFLRYNILYNLRSDLDFSNYIMNGCEDLLINKTVTSPFKFEFCENNIIGNTHQV